MEIFQSFSVFILWFELLTFIDDMLDGNIAVLVFIRFSSHLSNRKWIAAKSFNRFSKTMHGIIH